MGGRKNGADPSDDDKSSGKRLDQICQCRRIASGRRFTEASYRHSGSNAESYIEEAERRDLHAVWVSPAINDESAEMGNHIKEYIENE